MHISRPPFLRAATAFALLILAAPAFAQPDLSTLWPTDVGRVWEFDARVEGPFDEIATGVITHTVVSQTELSPGITVACFEVASTMPAAVTPSASGYPSRVARALGVVDQPSLLLRIPDCLLQVGVRVDDQTALGLWQSNGEWSWWWVPADPVQGSTFRLELHPGLADPAFENGEVRTLQGTVVTPAEAFTDAVIVDYVVELGESQIVEAGGVVIGTAVFEVVGWVAFVPGVGPVASEETFAPVEVDCPECPAEILEPVTTTMDLRATTPVGTEERSFGSLKARY